MECYEGSVTMPLSPEHGLPDLAGLLASSTCEPSQGICFSALTHSMGRRVATFGCWPRQSQSGDSLAWYGVPECKNEVRVYSDENHDITIVMSSSRAELVFKYPHTGQWH